MHTIFQDEIAEREIIEGFPEDLHVVDTDEFDEVGGIFGFLLGRGDAGVTVDIDVSRYMREREEQRSGMDEDEGDG